MIQKGDDLINGINSTHQYHIISNSQMANVSGTGNLVQSMSFEEYVPLESTLPPVETVLPQYIPTPPPSLPSPSVNIPTMNTTVPQFQLQHQTLAPPSSVQLQHNQNINNHQHQYYCDQHHQQVGFHSSSPLQLNQTHKNNNILDSTMNSQLFVDYKFSHQPLENINHKPMIDALPNNSHNHSIQSQETILNASDTSTVDANEAENINDDQFSYLQNLNSDNLMKFSQQSVLQQLIQEQIDVKPNLNLIPTYEEHDHGGYNFQIKVNSADEHSQRPGVVFSKETQKLYLKTNENVYIDCFYTQKMPIQPLKVRVFAIFEKDASAPVLRCQNHISTDNDPNEIIRKSLVRCKNADVVYSGSDTGKSINDRYSVVVPLNSTIKTNETNQLKQQLIVSFTCYNSCMNRKQTSVVFLLEGVNGEILAQRILSVKISTCPKRDKRLYEGTDVSMNKRKNCEDTSCAPTEAKVAKYDNTSIKDEYSRSSFEDASDDGALTSTLSGSVHHDAETGDFVLTLKYKSRQQLLQAISGVYGEAMKNEELRRSCVNGKRTRDSDYLKKLYYSVCNIKARNRSPISTE